MQKIYVIGIGARDPDHLTLQAAKAIGRTDVFFLLDKGEAKDSMIELRRTWTGSRRTRASAGTPRTTGWRRNGPRSRSIWPGGDAASWWCRPAIRACSRIESRLVAAIGADLVIAIYNPASRSRTEQPARALELLLERCAPDTPVVVGRDAGGPAESVSVTTLAALDPATIDMRCLLIIGSSQIRATVRGDGTPLVYTPRAYPG